MTRHLQGQGGDIQRPAFTASWVREDLLPLGLRRPSLTLPRLCLVESRGSSSAASVAYGGTGLGRKSMWVDLPCFDISYLCRQIYFRRVDFFLK